MKRTHWGSGAAHQYISRMLFGAFLVFVFLIPLSQYWSSRVLVVCVILALILSYRNWRMGRLFSESWDVLLYFAVLAIGLLYSDDLAGGLKVLETSLSLLAIPIIVNQFYEFKLDQLHQTFYAFALGLLTASLICGVYALMSFRDGGSIGVFFSYNLTSVIDSHPTYLAYYIIGAITFGLYSLYYERLILPTSMIVAMLLLLFFVLMLTGGITAFVSVLFILAFFLLKFILEGGARSNLVCLILVIAMISCLLLFSVLKPAGNVAGARSDDSWERLVLWESAIDANPSLLWGVGTGDYKTMLNAYYVEHNLHSYASANFNPHNQFIASFFANGMVGLACLLLMLGRPLLLSTRNGNVLGTLMVFPFLIYGITEVFLGRYQGVVFFALLHKLFIAYYAVHKPPLVLKRA